MLELEPDGLVLDEADEPLMAPQSFAAYCGSVGLRLAHFEDLLFCPERVAAGVLVAFSCDAPELLMCDCALSSPVDLLVLSVDDVPLMLPDVEPFALRLPDEPLVLLEVLGDGAVVAPIDPELPLVEP